jgi:hypothetical protein
VHKFIPGNFWHVSENSFYIEIIRVRYSGPDYFKAVVLYFSKASNALIAEEKNVTIKHHVTKFWERWDEKRNEEAKSN